MEPCQNELCFWMCSIFIPHLEVHTLEATSRQRRLPWWKREARSSSRGRCLQQTHLLGTKRRGHDTMRAGLCQLWQLTARVVGPATRSRCLGREPLSGREFGAPLHRELASSAPFVRKHCRSGLQTAPASQLAASSSFESKSQSASSRREQASYSSAADMAPRTGRVAVAQMTATSDIDANFETVRGLVKQAEAEGVQLLSLPECFSFIGAQEGEAGAIAEPLDGPIMQRYCQLARDSGMWLSLGGFQEVGDASAEGRYFNTHVLLDDNGAIVASYRKIHLFDVDVPGGPILVESRGTAPGAQLCAVPSPVGMLGLTVCYDLRFPELYQTLRFEQGAEVLLVPSAFTVKTGEAHWEILLRARAIECQCYVLAAAQAGRHNHKRESYGHALIIDPWGTVVARCQDPLATGLAVADVDPSLLASVRQRMPIESHRRVSLYRTRDRSTPGNAPSAAHKL